MKIVSCSECGLKIPTTQEVCPKCQHVISVDDENHVLVDQVGEANPSLGGTSEDHPQDGDAKDGLDEIDMAVTSLEVEQEEDFDVALIVAEKKTFDASRWIAAMGYIFFFIPLFFGYYKKSKFIKFHLKQAVSLLIFSIVLFMVLLHLRNRIDLLWSNQNYVNDMFDFLNRPEFGWETTHASGNFFNTHGLGVFLRTYILAMINALHVLPFGMMIIGIIHASKGNMRALPFIRRFTTKKK